MMSRCKLVWPGLLCIISWWTEFLILKLLSYSQCNAWLNIAKNTQETEQRKVEHEQSNERVKERKTMQKAIQFKTDII